MRTDKRSSPWRDAVLAVPLLLAALALPAIADADAARQGHDRGAGNAGVQWLGAWAKAMAPGTAEDSVIPLPEPLQDFDDQTIRQIAYLHYGGDFVRIRIANTYGDEPLVIGQANIGLQRQGAGIDPQSNRTLSFGGGPTITIPPGARVLSDAVRLRVRPGSELAVSLFITDGGASVTWHFDGVSTGYVSTTGNHAADGGGGSYPETITNYAWLDGIEVAATPRAAAVVTLGDSITDGNRSTLDANARYPDFLARRLFAHPRNRTSVLNVGFSGNRVLNSSPCFAENALARFDRDVLGQSGAKYLILLEGINDISFSSQPDEDCFTPNAEVSAADIIAGYRQIAKLARAKGIKPFVATLTPAGTTGEPEAKRLAVNAWIRTTGVFDGFVDFDRALRDPKDPSTLRDVYDSGDGLHPSDRGYEAMAKAVPLEWFQRNGR